MENRNDAGRKSRIRRAAMRGKGLVMAAFLIAFAAASARPASGQARTRQVQAAAAAPVKSYGSSSAPITMEVFSDYECPSCRNLFEQTLRPLVNDYVASGKVYLIHRDFPLPMHRYGYEAARWANAAARAGDFSSVEAALYDNQAAWSADGDIAKYVSAAVPTTDFRRIEGFMQGCGLEPAAGVKPAALTVAPAGRGCTLDPYIEADRAMGMRIPVQATPTYVITYKGQRLPPASGVVSWPILKQFFDSLLSQ